MQGKDCKIMYKSYPWGSVDKKDNSMKITDARAEAFHANEYPKETAALVTKKRERLKEGMLRFNDWVLETSL